MSRTCGKVFLGSPGIRYREMDDEVMDETIERWA